MADTFDAIQVKGQMRYRKNNKFIKAENVPDHVREVVNFDNVVDENGMVIVDQKTEEAKQVTDDELKKGEQNSEGGEVQEADAAGEDTPDSDDSDAADVSAGGDDEEDSKPDRKSQASPKLGVEDEEDSDEPTGPEPEPTPAKSKSQQRREAAMKEQPKFRSKVAQSDPGMGFPRHNGKTGDIFDVTVPHTKIKPVAGYAVPLSEKSFQSKTDAQIEARLRELGYAVKSTSDLEAEIARTTQHDDDLSDDNPSL